ncbi:MAG: DUF438 domain-containing protein [Candidatus Thorarchaeota archaeon]|nr:DUF438 domain-containing protein [Candidatus Thorarchaeota archaeon]
MAQDKKEALKVIIEKLHAGADPEEIKQEFRETIGDASATDISVAEEELIKEGMPRERIQKLCDVHLAVFRESIEAKGDIAPKGHPVYILMHEHQAQLDYAEELSSIARTILAEKRDPTSDERTRLAELVDSFREAESHYLREENVLFPYLEAHGVREPPAIMWMEHDQIRTIKKRLSETVENSGEIDLNGLVSASLALHEILSEHFYKENNILFPTAMNLVTEDEWKTIRKEFDEIGYCCFTPELPKSEKQDDSARTEISGGEIRLESGTMSLDVLEAILNTLPVDITFVDADDRVAYFSLSSERIFVRSKAVIGREVQYCHPKRSLDKVNQILDDFKNNRRDAAEFWINLNGRLIYIRYFAVRSKEGQYLGTLEVTQDITDIKQLQGEKRLLDEKPPVIMPTIQE